MLVSLEVVLTPVAGIQLLKRKRRVPSNLRLPLQATRKGEENSLDRLKIKSLLLLV